MKPNSSSRSCFTRFRIAVILAIIFLLLVTAAIIAPATWFYSPNTLTDNESFNEAGKIGNNPYVSYRAIFNFTASGGFNVGAPITVKAMITDVSMRNANSSVLTNFYCCVGFTHSFYQNPRWLGDGREANVLIHLNETSKGTYTGTGIMQFSQAGGSWSFLFPKGMSETIPLNQDAIQQGVPSITISDFSNTLAIGQAENSAKLTFFVGVAFGIVLFQPILEAILLPERKHDDDAGDVKGQTLIQKFRIQFRKETEEE